DVGVLGESARAVLRRTLRLAAAAEGIEPPAFLPVPGLHRGEALPRDFRADIPGTLLHLCPGRLDPSSAATHAAEDDTPGESQRLELLHVGGAAARREVLGEKLVQSDGASSAGGGK